MGHNQHRCDDIEEIVPKGYNWDGSTLSFNYRKDGLMPIANFIPVINGFYEVHDSAGCHQEIVITAAWQGGVMQRELTVESGNLQKLDLTILDSRLLYDPQAQSPQKHILHYVKCILQSTPLKKKTVIEKLGWNTVNGETIYCAGETLLNRDGRYDNSDGELEIRGEMQDFRLDIDESMSEVDAARNIINLIKLKAEVTAPLMAFLAQCILKNAYWAADCDPTAFWLVVVGSSELFKTTLAELCCTIYNRAESQGRCTEGLTSSNAACEIRLARLNDCVAIIDDFHIGDDKTEMRMQTRRFGTLLRAATNHTSRKKMRGNNIEAYECDASVVVTAERKLGAYSQASRLLYVDMHNKADGDKLNDIQDKPLIVPTFVSFFVPYIIRNTDKLTHSIWEFWKHHKRRDIVKNHDHIRIKNHCAKLKFSFGLLIEYFASTGALSAVEEADILNDTDIIFNDLYISNKNHLMINMETDRPYGEILYNNLSKFSYDAFKFRDGNIAIHPGIVVDFMRQHFQDANITDKMINKKLDENGLILKDASGRSTKKVGAKRMLHINIYAMTQLYEKNSN